MNFLLVIFILNALLRASKGYTYDSKRPLLIPSPSSQFGHFGYSLDWLKSSSVSHLGAELFVGAPKELPEGALYHCSITFDDVPNPIKCRNISPTINSTNGDTFKNQLLGISVAARHEGENSNSLWACAPHFQRTKLKYWPLKNEILEYSSHIGHCFIYQQNKRFLNPERVIPLEKEPMFFGREHYPEDYAFGALYAQAGMSLHHDAQRILIGAPGAWNWTGSLVILSSDGTNATLTQPYSLMEPQLNDYSGYSITSGHFDESQIPSILLGSPRSGKGRWGAVYVQNYNKGVVPLYKLEGDQIGEYFGASILCLDLTGDGIDEILIGSPLYDLIHHRSKRHEDSMGLLRSYEEGRILVYRMKADKSDFELALSILGEKHRGRFGALIASIGDINSDGVPDIVVSSPFEDESRGAIRIFLGHSTHLLHRKVSQTIFAQDISHHLFGFGISVSKALDVDNNGVKDIAIGSEGHAVILRTHPTVWIDFDFFSEPSFIDIGSKDEIKILLCLTLRSKSKGVSLNVSVHYSVDQRATFSTSVGNEGLLSTRKLMLYVDEEDCVPERGIKLSEKFNPSVQEPPLQLNVRVNQEKYEGNKFCKFCGILDKFKSSTSFLEIPFILHCQTDDGGDHTCYNDLSITVQSSKSSFVIGSSKNLSLIFRVKHEFGDIAFRPTLTLNYPFRSQIFRKMKGCTVSEEIHFIKCILRGPLSVGQSAELTLDFDVSEISGGEMNQLIWENIRIQSDNSFDLHVQNNMVNYELELKTEADFEISATKASFIQNLKDKNGNYFKSISVSTEFQVRKYLSSQMKNISTYFSIPCHFVINQILIDFINIHDVFVTSSSRKIANCHEFNSKVEGFQGNSERNSLHCNTTNIKCKIFKCPSFDLLTNDEVAKITLKLSLNAEALNANIDPSTYSKILIEGIVESLDLNPILNIHSDSAVFSIILFSTKSGFVSLSFIVTVCTSVFILFIIIYCLCCCTNFFERKKNSRITEIEYRFSDMNEKE